MSGAAPATVNRDEAALAAPAHPEMRHVSVLFVDLVGFTVLSEGRDAEDVRELLGRYFDSARTIVERYGGAVEKFIGDAVMAVWGVPVAHEDDAERAVRAALDVVDTVGAFGAEVGAPGSRARGSRDRAGGGGEESWCGVGDRGSGEHGLAGGQRRSRARCLWMR